MGWLTALCRCGAGGNDERVLMHPGGLLVLQTQEAAARQKVKAEWARTIVGISGKAQEQLQRWEASGVFETPRGGPNSQHRGESTSPAQAHSPLAGKSPQYTLTQADRVGRILATFDEDVDGMLNFTEMRVWGVVCEQAFMTKEDYDMIRTELRVRPQQKGVTADQLCEWYDGREPRVLESHYAACQAIEARKRPQQGRRSTGRAGGNQPTEPPPQQQMHTPRGGAAAVAPRPRIAGVPGAPRQPPPELLMVHLVDLHEAVAHVHGDIFAHSRSGVAVAQKRWIVGALRVVQVVLQRYGLAANNRMLTAVAEWADVEGGCALSPSVLHKASAAPRWLVDTRNGGARYRSTSTSPSKADDGGHTATGRVKANSVMSDQSDFHLTISEDSYMETDGMPSGMHGGMKGGVSYGGSEWSVSMYSKSCPYSPLSSGCSYSPQLSAAGVPEAMEATRSPGGALQRAAAEEAPADASAAGQGATAFSQSHPPSYRTLFSRSWRAGSHDPPAAVGERGPSRDAGASTTTIGGRSDSLPWSAGNSSMSPRPAVPPSGAGAAAGPTSFNPLANSQSRSPTRIQLPPAYDGSSPVSLRGRSGTLTPPPRMRVVAAFTPPTSPEVPVQGETGRREAQHVGGAHDNGNDNTNTPRIEELVIQTFTSAVAVRCVGSDGEGRGFPGVEDGTTTPPSHPAHVIASPSPSPELSAAIAAGVRPRASTTTQRSSSGGLSDDMVLSPATRAEHSPAVSVGAMPLGGPRAQPPAALSPTPSIPPGTPPSRSPVPGKVETGADPLPRPLLPPTRTVMVVKLGVAPTEDQPYKGDGVQRYLTLCKHEKAGEAMRAAAVAAPQQLPVKGRYVLAAGRQQQQQSPPGMRPRSASPPVGPRPRSISPTGGRNVANTPLRRSNSGMRGKGGAAAGKRAATPTPWASPTKPGVAGGGKQSPAQADASAPSGVKTFSPPARDFAVDAGYHWVLEVEVQGRRGEGGEEAAVHDAAAAAAVDAHTIGANRGDKKEQENGKAAPAVDPTGPVLAYASLSSQPSSEDGVAVRDGGAGETKKAYLTLDNAPPRHSGSVYVGATTDRAKRAVFGITPVAPGDAARGVYLHSTFTPQPLNNGARSPPYPVYLSVHHYLDTDKCNAGGSRMWLAAHDRPNDQAVFALVRPPMSVSAVAAAGAVGDAFSRSDSKMSVPATGRLEQARLARSMGRVRRVQSAGAMDVSPPAPARRGRSGAGSPPPVVRKATAARPRYGSQPPARFGGVREAAEASTSIPTTTVDAAAGGTTTATTAAAAPPPAKNRGAKKPDSSNVQGSPQGRRGGARGSGGARKATPSGAGRRV